MTQAESTKPAGAPPFSHRIRNTEPPMIDEKGAPLNGEPQILSTRLFMQLQAYGNCRDAQPLIDAIKAAKIPAVLYADVNDPQGVAILTWAEDPSHFVDAVRPLLNAEPFVSLEHKPRFTMFGRTYALGHEANLREWLFDKPIATATNGDWPWAVWYPLRRRGSFAKLDPAEQRQILMEHALIGMSFVDADYAHDIRLACPGLDADDNDFVIGLVGKSLHPLSAIVQNMRKTTQTALYLENLGPFFVGKVLHQSV
ncbi:MAG: hypothetical protein GC162_00195 [Planctomycetes bacterium]|nr:hypothetical protein [Planctomycetota bacterium]